MSLGSDILAVEYNNIRSKALQILGAGAGTVGYGQSLNSSPVFPGNIITAAQWQALRNDIVNIKLHQDGVVPPIAEIIQGTPIRFGGIHPNRQWDTVLDQALSTRFKIGGGRFSVSQAISQSRTGSWDTQSQCEATITFLDADNARYFFNTGGKIRFFSTRTGGASTQQNNAWTGMLLSIGIQQFTGDINNPENFYTLTDSYKTIFLRALSTPYSMNFYRVESRCNVTNNSIGGATQLNFRFTWRDDYTDPGLPPPGDEIDGTLSLTLEELKAVGNFIPAGSFNIQSPSYSITSISAT